MEESPGRTLFYRDRWAGFGARFAPEWVERQVGGAREASLSPWQQQARRKLLKIKTLWVFQIGPKVSFFRQVLHGRK
jgi:hypothetical protein